MFIERLKQAKDELREAKEMHCTCNSTALQIDGCGCERGKEIQKAQHKIDLLVESVKC